MLKVYVALLLLVSVVAFVVTGPATVARQRLLVALAVFAEAAAILLGRRAGDDLANSACEQSASFAPVVGVTSITGLVFAAANLYLATKSRLRRPIGIAAVFLVACLVASLVAWFIRSFCIGIY